MTDGADIQADLDANNKRIKEIQAANAKDFSELEARLKAMEDCKISGVDDIAEAKTIIEDAKKIKANSKNIKKNIAEMKKLIDDSRNRVATAAEDIKAQTKAAQEQVTGQIKKVKEPLTQSKQDIAALTQTAKDAAAVLRKGKKDLQAAMKKDVAAAKNQYGVDGLKGGVEGLMKKILGDNLYGKLKTGHSYYKIIKPWLPVTDKGEKEKRQNVIGSDFDFSLPMDEGGQPAIWIQKSALSGTFLLNDQPMDFSGTMNDFASNVHFTGKPISLIVSAAGVESPQTMSLDVKYDTSGAIVGEMLIDNLSFHQETPSLNGEAGADDESSESNESNESKESSKIAGLAPQSIHCGNVSMHITQLHLADKRMDAVIECTMKDLRLGPASGAGVHKELAAVFSETYSQLKELKIFIGIGAHKIFRTEPNISQSLAAGLRKKVQQRLDKARKQAEDSIRQRAGAQGVELDTLADDFTQLQDITDKKAELAAASKSFVALEKTEGDRLLAEEKSAQKSLGQYDDELQQQDAAASSEEKKMDKIVAQIKKEKKRLEKKILGGGLKDIFKRF
ncbi:MAG: hypothetical protein HRU15_19315 [Planctomycetes bacterium]|nr:hypothetical protein [Planctomycetota bacterium]